MIEVLKAVGILLYLLFASFCIGEAIGEYRAEKRERKTRKKKET